MDILYHKRLKPVIRYIEQNYNSQLNLVQVAQMAHLSPYYFHRVFKAVSGETLADFIRRLRMEEAARLLFYNNSNVTNVAMELGFSSSQSLAKAFKKHFDLTPSDFRQCKSLGELSKLLEKSKIGRSQRNFGHAAEQSAVYANAELNKGREIMKTQFMAARSLAYVRVNGPYGENYQPAVQKLYGWAGPKGLAGGESIFIYHDNPEVTALEKCRTDICISVPEGTQVSGEIELCQLPEGVYATEREPVTEKVHYAQHWESLMGQIVETGIELDDRPCFELYYQYDPATGHGDVGFFTPVKVD